jgi:hypothetical protein
MTKKREGAPNRIAVTQLPINASFPAKQKINGRREVLEGKKRFIEAIAGEFTIDWSQQRYGNADDSQEIRRRNALAVST